MTVGNMSQQCDTCQVICNQQFFLKNFFFFGDFISFIEKLKSWVHQNQFLGEGKKTELIIEKKVAIIWATTEPREYILIIEKF